jgi:hypothetical protein
VRILNELWVCFSGVRIVKELAGNGHQKPQSSADSALLQVEGSGSDGGMIFWWPMALLGGGCAGGAGWDFGCGWVGIGQREKAK